MTTWPETELGIVAPYVKEKIDASILDASNFISTDNMLPNVGGITLSDYVPTTGKVASYQSNDVLVSNIRPYFKKIWRARQSGGCSNDVLVFRANTKKIAPKFLYYQLSQNDFFDFMMAGANGVKMPRGNRNLIPKYKFQLPTLPIQQKIAGILSAYDDLIENNLKRIKLLEEMAQVTYEEWFVRLRFPSHESTPINPETGLPEGWKKRKMSDFCSKVTDGTHDSPKQSESGYKLVTGKHIINGFLDFDTAYLISEEDHQKIKKRSGLAKGDILFSNIGTLGSAAMVTEDFEFSCKNVIIFKQKQNQSNFLFTYLTNKNTQNKFFGQSSGVAQKFFSLKFIREFEDNFSPDKIVEQFDSFVSGIYKLKYQLNYQNQCLREARDILLPRLMTGVIDVESYDPAQLLKEAA